jgi:hypothetical protein
MDSGDDARGERQRGTVLERIKEIILAGKNHGQMGLRQLPYFDHNPPPTSEKNIDRSKKLRL